ncbi:MAG TPA: C4-dicarboxylate ABC transporter, partial [Rhodospirillaceae bacterium]|nr:C4-dicarboxylate ABC transporter [Rhodospirillaceae bacterium]
MSDKNNEAGLSQSELDDLVASNDTGGRAPTNQTLVLAMATIALLWSLFQVWIASPIPYEIGFGAFSSKDARAIHLTFALILAFMAYPAFKSSPRSYIPITDWIIMFLGASCAFYYFAADM